MQPCADHILHMIIRKHEMCMRKFFLKGFSRLELIPVLATSVHLHLSASALLTNTPLSYFTIQCGTVIVHLNNGKGLRGVFKKLLGDPVLESCPNFAEFTDP